MDGLFESCCRLCLAHLDSDQLNSIFQYENNHLIAEIISDVCSVDIHRNDLLPKEICTECYDIVTKAHLLRIKSQKNDQIMRGPNLMIKEEAEDLVKYEPLPSPIAFESSFDVIEEEEDDDEEDMNESKAAFNCDRCDEVRKSRQDIKVHIQHEHLNICSVCSKHCSSQAMLKQHLHRMHFKESIPCDACHLSFATTTKLKKHKQIHVHYDEQTTDGDPQVHYKCRFEGCSKVYAGISEKMFEHFKYHKKQDPDRGKRKYPSTRDESLVCPHCGQIYKSKQILQQHIKRHFDSGDKYACPKCPQKFKSW
jgi:uncharacterized C2H2 Zn-finger protein